MSDSVRPHRQQPTRLRHPWDSPDKNTRVGCHFLLQYIKVKSESEVAQCPTLHDPMDCSLPGSSIHGIFQARVLEWGAIAFSISYDSSCLIFLTDILIDLFFKFLVFTPSFHNMKFYRNRHTLVFLEVLVDLLCNDPIFKILPIKSQMNFVLKHSSYKNQESLYIL